MTVAGPDPGRQPKILVIDCETAPNVIHAWSLFNVNASLNQIVAPSYTLGFAWQWAGQKTVRYVSVYHDGHQKMVETAWKLLDEADAVTGYNIDRFDLPVLRKDIISTIPEWGPPSPFKSIDLYKVVRKNFKFTSGKLAFVTEALGLSGKLDNSGHAMWKQCMDAVDGVGDPAVGRRAQNEMKRYCMADVRTTTELHLLLRPYLGGQFSYGAFADETETVCPGCGGSRLVRRGFTHTAASRYQRFQCADCHRWCRSARSSQRAGVTAISAGGRGLRRRALRHDCRGTRVVAA